METLALARAAAPSASGLIGRSADHHQGVSALELVELFNDFDALLAHLGDELDRAARAGGREREEAVVDAFLLAAGVDQVVEDFVHQPPHAADAIVRRIDGSPTSFGGLAAARVLRVVSSAHTRRHHAILKWHARLEEMVTGLAALTLARTGGPPSDGEVAAARAQAGWLARTGRRLTPALRGTVLRLPDCFRSFDQHPNDCSRLAARFSGCWPDRSRPLLVIGVRTSGSYLAPLQAAALRGLGYADVQWATYRPGHPWLAAERAKLEGVRKAGGLVLLVDDPPVTGRKLAQVATAVEEAGFSPQSVILLIAVFGTEESLPDTLRARPAVILPWRDWAFQGRLDGPALLETLSELLVGRQVADARYETPVHVDAVLAAEPTALEIIRDPLARPIVRSHCRMTARVHLRTNEGIPLSLDVYVKGSGLGYFGRHSMAISRKLAGLVPDVYGWSEGFLFRQALAEENRLPARRDVDARHIAQAVAAYAVGRAVRVAVSEDTSRYLRGRHPAWELAANVLTAGLGAWTPAAAPLARRASISLLRCERPAIVDGSPALDHWFVGDGGALLKADFDERAFSVWDHACYDVAWDVAGTAASHRMRVARDRRLDGRGDEDLAHELLVEYQRVSGEVVSPERWVLYQTLHLLSWRHHLTRLLAQGVGQLQTQDGTPPPRPDVEEDGFAGDLLVWRSACDRSQVRVASQYLAELFLQDKTAVESGPLCAVAIDEMIERGGAEAGALTRPGALALRSLLAHGLRLVLITGAPLEELAWRCRAYRAAGGVARDGVIVPGGRTVRRRLNPHDPSAALAGMTGGQPLVTVSSRSALQQLLGHRPGSCPRCRLPQLPWESRLVGAALDAGQDARLRQLGRILPAMVVVAGRES